MGGKAVLAKQGLRNQYKPLNTKLCSNSDPIAITEAYLSLHSFKTIYIADLDRIMDCGNNLRIIQNLTAKFRGIEFWIDQGLVDASAHINYPNSRIVGVIGSESIDDQSLVNLFERDKQDFILSLDFSAEGLLGPSTLSNNSERWPRRLIIMSLAYVGSNRGPDWTRIKYYLNRWPTKSIYAAGGVQSEADLNRLAGLGVSGVLLASVLHTGALDPGVLIKYR